MIVEYNRKTHPRNGQNTNWARKVNHLVSSIFWHIWIMYPTTPSWVRYPKEITFKKLDVNKAFDSNKFKNSWFLFPLPTYMYGAQNGFMQMNFQWRGFWLTTYGLHTSIFWAFALKMRRNRFITQNGIVFKRLTDAMRP